MPLTVCASVPDMISGIRRLAHFYNHESCGQCTPCREGTPWLESTLKRIEEGKADFREIEALRKRTKYIEQRTICALGDAAAWPVQGLLDAFPEAVEARVRGETVKNPKMDCWSGSPFANEDWVSQYE
jgi:NADH:ubiquinone oxidoreductase subunit F (NADH-binding)